jgi:hypothetical protein
VSAIRLTKTLVKPRRNENTMSKYTYAIQTNLKYNYESRLAQHIIDNYGFNALDELFMNMLDRAMAEHDMYSNNTNAENLSEEFIANVAKRMLKEYR